MTSRAGPEINLAFKEMITNLVLASRLNCQGSSTKMGPCSCQYCAVQLWCFHLADLWYKYQNNMINIPFKDNSIHINNSCCSLSFLFLNKMINCKQAKSPTLLVPILLSLTWSNWDYCNLDGTLIHHNFSLLWGSRIINILNPASTENQTFCSRNQQINSTQQKQRLKHDFQKVFNRDLKQMKPIDHKNSLDTKQPIVMEAQ